MFVPSSRWITVRGFGLALTRGTPLAPHISAIVSKHSPPKRSKHTSTDVRLQTPARVRFAPSPTGYLHLGSLRTALFNYLVARRTNGTFILRVEDTDEKRFVADAEKRLCEDLRWAGLKWDEGPGVGGPDAPYTQSERTALYRDHAELLLRSKAAFRCFCSSNRDLEPLALSNGAQDLDQVSASVSGCQQSCYDLPPEEVQAKISNHESYVVRLSRHIRTPTWSDMTLGKIQGGTSGRFLRDSVLVKSNGTPTYHLANVIDDHLMRITHVIRGSEWLDSTALHVALYQAFGWTPPRFNHVGLLTDEEGNKLSKRNLDTDIRSLREEQDILPETLVNFLALLGWRNPHKTDLMDLEQLKRNFSFKFTKGNAVVCFGKLWFLQRQHAKERIMDATRSETEGVKLGFTQLVDSLRKRISTTASMRSDLADILGGRSLETYLVHVLFADSGYYENSEQYLRRNSFFFTRGSTQEAEPRAEQVYLAAEEVLNDPAVRKSIAHRYEAGESLQDIYSRMQESSKLINQCIVERAREQASITAGMAGAKTGKGIKEEAKSLSRAVHECFRDYLSNGMPCPSTGEVMTVLGWDEVAYRMSDFLRPLREDGYEK